MWGDEEERRWMLSWGGVWCRRWGGAHRLLGRSCLAQAQQLLPTCALIAFHLLSPPSSSFHSEAEVFLFHILRDDTYLSDIFT